MSAVPQSHLHTLDAPFDGWNAFDSIDNMPPTAALVLDNLIPSTGTVITRQGTVEFADVGTGLPLETLADFSARTVTKLIAASDGGLWDITDPTPAQVFAARSAPGGYLGAASAIDNLAPASTYTIDRWQTQNFRKADEEGILVMCNGFDTPQIIFEPDPVGAPGVLDVRDIVDTNDVMLSFTENFIGCLLFKGRMYYWKDNDNAFYYAQAGAYEGEFEKFDLGAFAQLGGKITLITSWTQQDSGDGKDDFFVVCFASGETLLYQGDDPGNLGFWELIGRYEMGEPLSIRGTQQYGADRIIMTKDGYVGLASVIQQGRTSDVPQFSRLIHNAIKQQTELRSQFYGWDCILYQKDGLFIFNVPLSDTTFSQHVVNTVTQRWCRFTEINVNCLEAHDDRLFGGTSDGRVLALLETTADEGGPIEFTALPAYDYLGDPGRQKHVVALQPQTTHDQPELIQLTGYADFDVPDILPVDLPSGAIQATWSVDPPTPPAALGSHWDSDFWATDLTPFTTKGWQNISANGYAVSYLLRFAELNNSVTWRSTTVRFYVTGGQ